MKLYYVPNTRATRPRWMLEELEVPYELIALDPKKAENKSAGYLAIHPLGKVPALVDGEVRMFESAAIVAWLADRYPEKGFAPAPGTPERAAYEQWLHFGMSTLEPALVDVSGHTRTRPEEKRVPHIAEEAKESFWVSADVLEEHLTARLYLLGERFSAADVVVGSILSWARSLKLLAGRPALEAYVARLVERPAWKRSRA